MTNNRQIKKSRTPHSTFVVSLCQMPSFVRMVGLHSFKHHLYLSALPFNVPLQVFYFLYSYVCSPPTTHTMVFELNYCYYTETQITKHILAPLSS